MINSIEFNPVTVTDIIIFSSCSSNNRCSICTGFSDCTSDGITTLVNFDFRDNYDYSSHTITDSISTTIPWNFNSAIATGPNGLYVYEDIATATQASLGPLPEMWTLGVWMKPE